MSLKLWTNKKGFTLVELMVVVAILGILVAVAVLVYSNVTQKAAYTAVQANVRTLESAIMQAESVTGSSLATTAELKADTAIGTAKLNEYIADSVFANHKGFVTVKYSYDKDTHAVTAATTTPDYSITNKSEYVKK